MTQSFGGGILLLLRRRLHDNPLLKSKKRIPHFTKKNLENILTDSLFRRDTFQSNLFLSKLSTHAMHTAQQEIRRRNAIYSFVTLFEYYHFVMLFDYRLCK